MRLEVNGAQAKTLFWAIKSVWQHETLGGHYKRVRVSQLDDEHLDVYYRNQYTEVTVWWPVDVRHGVPGERYEVDADTVGRFLSDKGSGSIGLDIEGNKMTVTDYQFTLVRDVYPDIKMPEPGVYLEEEELELLGRVKVGTLRAVCERIMRVSMPKQSRYLPEGTFSCFWLGFYTEKLYAVSTDKKAAVEIWADWESGAPEKAECAHFEIEVARQLYHLAGLWSVRHLVGETWCNIYRRVGTNQTIFNLAGYGTEASLLTSHDPTKPSTLSALGRLHSIIPDPQAQGVGFTVNITKFEQLLLKGDEMLTKSATNRLRATIQAHKMYVTVDEVDVGDIDICEMCWYSLPGRRVTMYFTPKHFLHLMQGEEGNMSFKFNVGEETPLRAQALVANMEVKYLGMPATGGCHE